MEEPGEGLSGKERFMIVCRCDWTEKGKYFRKRIRLTGAAGETDTDTDTLN